MKKLVIFAIAIALAACSKIDKQDATDDVLKPFKGRKDATVHKELTAEIIAQLKDNEVEQAVFDNIDHNMKGDSRPLTERVQALTAGQRAVFVTWLVEEETYKGGLERFFLGDFSALNDMTEESFRIIGAPKFADLMKETNELAKAQGRKPNIDAFEDLTDKFVDLYKVESLDFLKVKYIRGNTNEFVKQAAQ